MSQQEGAHTSRTGRQRPGNGRVLGPGHPGGKEQTVRVSVESVDVQTAQTVSRQGRGLSELLFPRGQGQWQHVSHKDRDDGGTAEVGQACWNEKRLKPERQTPELTRKQLLRLLEHLSRQVAPNLLAVSCALSASGGFQGANLTPQSPFPCLTSLICAAGPALPPLSSPARPD